VNVLGIIPARSQSRRVRDKNIKPLAGRPLIYYTIREALKAKTLNRVIVSTDSKYYADIARESGAEVPFLRPKRISGDDVGTTPVLIHCIEYLEKHEHYHVDVIVTLQPTCPFRLALDVDHAVKKLFATGADSVVSVREVTEPPHWMFTLKADKMTPFLGMDTGKLGLMTRAKLPKLYLPNGAVYVTRTDVVMNQRRIYGEDCRAIIMPPQRSLDVDTPQEFEYAEYLMKKRRESGCEKS